MRKRYLNVTDAELQVLKTLWKDGPSTIRELTGKLYPAGGVSFYATVQKLLERLKSKSCVDRERRGRGHLYSAVVKRSELIAGRIEETVDKLCEGSVTPLITHLVGSDDFSREDADALRLLLRKIDRDEEVNE